MDERDFWRNGRSGEGSARSEEISVAVSFSELSADEKVLYSDFLDGDGRLTLERHFAEPGPGTYLGTRLANEDFSKVRNLPKGHRDAFNELVDTGAHEGLHKASGKDEALEQMEAWEKANPEKCQVVEQEIRFPLLPSSDPSSIAAHLHFVLVGATEDPTTHLEEGRTAGAIGQLIQESVKTDQLKTDLQQVADSAAGSIKEVLEEHSHGFEAILEEVGQVIDRFAPGFSLRFAWNEVKPTAGSVPAVQVSVATDDGLTTDLQYQGQGVQRSLMYGVLTAQAEANDSGGAGKTLLLAIEEPEAFQHPLSARVLSRTLTELASRNYQILLSTHSPHLIHPTAIDGIRLFQRIQADDYGFETSIHPFSLDEMARELSEATGNHEITAVTLAARLHANLETRILEGLFARACVLVEGDEDEGLIRAACSLKKLDLDEAGVAIIQARGKNAMPLLTAFFRHAGVEVYPVFDLDRGKPENEQSRWAEKAIQLLLNESEEQLSGNQVRPAFAHWNDDLGCCVEEEIGDPFQTLLDEVSAELGYLPSQGRKVAPVLKEVIGRAAALGHTSQSLNDLTEQISVIVST